MEIQELREKIDQIDRELVSLFCERMNVAADVAEYKREHKLPVLDASRERALLTKVAELSGEEFEEYTRTLYATLLSLSRSYQHKRLGETSPLCDAIASAVANTAPVFPERAVVACQGVEGAYSQSAAEKLFRLPSIMFFSQFDSVFSAIESGMCRYGVLPIENSTAGSVKQVYDLMIRHQFKIVRSVRIKIDHNLLVKKGTKLSDVKEIFSHEQAIGQCSAFLATLPPNIKVTRVENTAVAARMVAQSDRTDVASLSSRSCASLYGLEVLAGSVQDNGNNHTRFICISKDLEIYPGADRISLMLITAHRPGSLFNILSRFNSLGINLLKLESRPLPDRDFEFMFYFDLEASVYAEKTAQLLAELEQECDDFSYLGSYSEVV
ncbi:MAG: bifunctional chorismate mutase/prephenate dehydratase [Ruminococcaceae bacterium]|nr:bifunctional chorismate mutase/prephenate dehydratase [Oscillospiraceae bacterium]